MSIQAVSFGKQAITKKGNQYEKTNLGGKIGALAGAGYATYDIIKSKKSLNAFKLRNMYEQAVANTPQKYAQFTPTFREFATLTKKLVPVMFVVVPSLIVLAGFGLGKIADAITNKVRRNKADSQNA